MVAAAVADGNGAQGDNYKRHGSDGFDDDDDGGDDDDDDDQCPDLILEIFVDVLEGRLLFEGFCFLYKTRLSVLLRCVQYCNRQQLELWRSWSCRKTQF